MRRAIIDVHLAAMRHDMQFAEFAVRRVHTSKSIRFCRTEKRVVKRQVKLKIG